MLRRIFVSLILLLLPALLTCVHHYHIESILAPETTRRIIEQNGGTIITELQFTGRTSYHVSFAEKFSPYSKQQKLLWLRIEKMRGNRLPTRFLNRHPSIRLSYQPPLRVAQRTKYDCSIKAVFPSVQADVLLSVRPKHPRTPNTTYDIEVLKMIEKVRKITKFNDPGAPYAKQYINDGAGISPYIGYDINVYPAYTLGLTGRGVKVLILDDAVDMDHCDLSTNFNAEISNNLVDPGKDSKLPVPPGPVIDKNNGHGTQCAGLVAGIANNTYCSHGVAYDASVGGVRLLGEHVTDTLEAEAFSYRSDIVDIYCASWGPTDDGMTMDKPRKLTLNAIKTGWKNGRGGLGSIFVFASGNGGSKNDNCGADGFVGRPEIISVGALDEMGTKTKYAEACASLRCAVPVGGLHSQGDILPSVKPNSECLLNFAGTSAAAPLAAGCFALAVQANPKLTPRDLEHLIVWSTRFPNKEDQDWVMNAAGLLHSVRLGFGLLDCTRMALLAQKWNKVGPLCINKAKTGTRQEGSWASQQAAVPTDKKFRQISSVEEATQLLKNMTADDRNYKARMEAGSETKIEMTVTSIEGELFEQQPPGKCNVEVLEKVVVTIQWDQLCRGTTSIWLTSPTGTKTKLLAPRELDVYNGPTEMTFTSVAQWGESVKGQWTIAFQVTNTCSNQAVKNLPEKLRGVVYSVQLEFWGTNKHDSGFQRNHQVLDQFVTPLGRRAQTNQKAHTLSASQREAIFIFQRDLALKFTNAALKEKYP